MSFSSHRQKALDPDLPISHRMSHLRSCAMLIGQKYGVPRSQIINRVQQVCGVDLNASLSETNIVQAIEILETLKRDGLKSVLANGQG